MFSSYQNSYKSSPFVTNLLLNILGFNICKSTLHPLLTLTEITSLYAPQGAEAAATNKIVVKNGKHAVKTKNIYIGGKVVDFDAVVKGKPVKDSKGTWKSSNKKIASVDKNGKVKALKNGKVTISFKTKATKKVKSVTVKMTINARTRASKMILTPAAVVVKEGEKSTVGVSYEISKKIQAAGGKTTTYKLFAESSDEKAAKVSVEGNDKIVVEGVAKSATPVSITVYAAQVTNIAKAKEVRIKLTEKFDVKVNSKFDAKQVKANKILVTGTNLSTKAAAYVVKNVNGIVLNLKDKVEVNKDGTEATLEAVVNQIPEGKYTVTYDKEDPAEFTAVKQVLDKIVIEPADKAILVKDSGNKVAVAYYKALDNFGEDVTKESLGAGINANGNQITTKGAVRFEQNSGFLPGQTILLTLVDSITGKNTSATLTISQYSMLSDITFKGVYDKNNKKLVDSIGERATLSDYVMLFEGKDQYGLEMNAVGEMSVVIGGATGLKTEKLNDLFKYEGKEYMAFKLDRFTQSKLNAGEATIQAFSTTTGKQSTPVKFNVTSDREVKTLTIGNGSRTIVAGEDAELSYSAYDAEGKAVTDFEVLNRIKFTGGSGKGLRFEKKAGKAVLMYMPAAKKDITEAQQEYVTYITPTNNFGSAVLTVNPASVPAKIAGLKKNVGTVITASGNSAGVDNTLILKASDLVLKDQYGNDIDFDKLGTNYALKVVLENGTGAKVGNGFSIYTVTGTAVTAANAVYTASFGSITGHASNYTLDKAEGGIVRAVVTSPAVAADLNVSLSLVQLKDNKIEEVAGSGYSFKITAAVTSEVKDVMVEDIKLVEASSGTSVNYVEPVVVGNVDGKRVVLVRGKDYEIVVNTNKVPDTKSLTNGATEGKATVSIIVMDGKGTRVNKEYTFSNKPRVIASAEVNDGASGKVVSASSVVTVENVLNALTVKDQYGNKYNTNDIKKLTYVTFTDLPTDAKVDRNGGSDAKIIAGVKKDSEITVKVSFAGSTYVFEKTLVIAND